MSTSAALPVPAVQGAVPPEAPAQGEVLLRLRGIGRRYGDAHLAPALNDVNCTILAGEFVAIIGASGAGKSTLLNLLGLLDTPDEGEYWVGDVPVKTLGDRERDLLRASTFGFVFQDSHMLLKETAAGNAALGLGINRVDPALRPEIVAEALAEVGMLGKADELSGNLSGGERQRVAIARAIAVRPRILLADEPTGALDRANSQRVVGILQALNRAGVTVILVTHNPEVAAVANRVIEVSDGRIVSDSTVSAAAAPTAAPDSRAARVAALPARTQRRLSRVWERLALAISNHTVHSARAALLLLAFTVGAAGLVTAIGLSESAASQVVNRLDSAVLDEFLVVPRQDPEGVRQELALPAAAPADEVARVAAARIAELAGVRSVGQTASTSYDGAVTLFDPAQLTVQDTRKPPIRLADSEYLRQQGVRFGATDQGLQAFASDSDVPVAILGPELAQQLGMETPRPGAQIWIGTTPVAILGVINDLGREPQYASALIVNPVLAATVQAEDATLLVSTVPGGPARIAARVGAAATPGNPELYRAEKVADLRSLTRGVASDLVSLVNIVSWVLLALASLSAAIAAYLSVHARISEIALRRAVGESKRSVWGQFVLEGLIVGVFGGLLGSGLGVVLLVVVAAGQGWTPVFNLLFLGVGVVTGAATGVLASLYPAAVAARQDPALAVRGT